ncbi:unnamed protein product [Nezara viridula]|uniref:Uncharacterized protein n=1 Tax=Nezara viridula TaxID=85310 RepID=A0A9P0H6A2_NEZVI|nr:unnamed protein product [Nezara viridula]
MFSVLFLFGLVSTALSFPGPVGVTEGLPELQVEEFFDKVAVTVFSKLSKSTDLPEVNWGIDSIYGIPFKLRIQTKQGKLESPTEVKRITRVSGVQEASGTAHVEGYLYLGKLQVTYETFTVNIFGLELTGKAMANINEVTTPVNIHIYKNSVKPQSTTATIGELNGYVTVHLGSDTGYQAVLNYILDAVFILRYVHDAFRWAFFQSIVPIIEQALSEAATTITL